MNVQTKLGLAMGIALLGPLSVQAHAGDGVPGTPCDSIWHQPLAEGEALMADRAIRARRQTPSDPSQRVYEHMAAGPWHIVWVEDDVSEPGAFFIRKSGNHIRGSLVFGGVATKDERAEVQKWAASAAKDFPPDLAACFAWYVVDGRYGDTTAPANPFNGGPGAGRSGGT